MIHDKNQKKINLPIGNPVEHHGNIFIDNADHKYADTKRSIFLINGD